jgi:hypothetical protein
MLPRTYSLTADQLQQLAVISGQSAEQLATMQSPPTKNNHTSFLGWNVSESEIERGRTRICPECVADQSVHKQIWNLRIITVCPVHGAKIIDSCPVCDDPLSWSRLDIGRCANGHPLKQGVSGRRRVPHKDLSGVRALYEKCGVSLESTKELLKLPEAIRKLDLREFVAFLLVVGRAAVGEKAGWRVFGQYRYDPDRTHQVLCAGYEMARAWPDSFIERLGEIHAQSGRKSHHIGLGREVGGLLRMFAYRDDQPFLEIVKSAIRTYVARNRVFLHYRTKQLLGYVEDEEPDYISAEQARAILKRSKETTRKLAIANGWCTAAPGAGNVLRIDKRKMEQWLKNESTMTGAEAGRVLGVPRSGVSALFQCGLLVGALGDSECSQDVGRRLVRKAIVDRILRIIERPVMVEKDHPAEVLLSWRGFQSRARTKGLHLGSVLQAMEEGKLSARARDKKARGFRGLRFGLIDLLEWTESASADRGARLRDRADLLVSLRDAALITAEHLPSIYRAVAVKLLTTKMAHDRLRTRLVRLGDLEKFTKLYSTVGRLAKDNGVHVNKVKRALHRLNMDPIGGRKGPYGQCSIYLNADLKREQFNKEVTSRSLTTRRHKKRSAGAPT